jgi:hypothetical protein
MDAQQTSAWKRSGIALIQRLATKHYPLSNPGLHQAREEVIAKDEIATDTNLVP